MSVLDESDQTISEICTRKQLEIFHKTLFTDLYRRDRIVDFTDMKEDEKKYYVLPLKMTQR